MAQQSNFQNALLWNEHCSVLSNSIIQKNEDSEIISEFKEKVALLENSDGINLHISFHIQNEDCFQTFASNYVRRWVFSNSEYKNWFIWRTHITSCISWRVYSKIIC